MIVESLHKENPVNYKKEKIKFFHKEGENLSCQVKKNLSSVIYLTGYLEHLLYNLLMLITTAVTITVVWQINTLNNHIKQEFEYNKHIGK